MIVCNSADIKSDWMLF